MFGFGHAVLRQEDPRATIQYAWGDRSTSRRTSWSRRPITLRNVVPPILKENPKIQNPYPNVDAVSGSLLTAAGLTDPDYYTLLFGWSRVAGIAAQIVDERNYPGKKDGLADLPSEVHRRRPARQPPVGTRTRTHDAPSAPGRRRVVRFGMSRSESGSASGSDPDAVRMAGPVNPAMPRPSCSCSCS